MSTGNNKVVHLDATRFSIAPAAPKAPTPNKCESDLGVAYSSFLISLLKLRDQNLIKFCDEVMASGVDADLYCKAQKLKQITEQHSR